jgi:prevent-host-death family protein
MELIMSQQEFTKIPATKIHRNFGEILRRMYAGEAFIIEKDGLRVGAIIPLSELEELERLHKDREARLKRFQENARAMGAEFEKRGITEEQMMDDLEKIRQQLYEEQYGDTER